MNLQAEKIELAKMVLDREDEDLIKEIKALFKKKKKDFWLDLPEHVRKDTIEAQQQYANGDYISFDEAKKVLADET